VATSWRGRLGATGRRRGPGVAAAVLIGAAAVVGWSSLGRAAGASGAYQLTSAADGVRVTVSAANAPVTNVPFDLGAPVAQATLDSLQTSQSFAALPYPGDLVVAGPGTTAGFSGGKVTPPNYPFIVQASNPVTPEATLDKPGYRLHASAGPSEAASSASSGLRRDSGAVAAAVATSEARRGDDGTLRAASASEVTGFSAGPLTIGSVRSTAEVVAPASGPPTKRSELDVRGVKVGDVAVEITPGGIRLAGSQTPLPPTGAVAQALRTNGVELGYLSPRQTDDVVVSPAVAVTVTRSLDGPVSRIRVTYILGRSVARIGTASGSSDSAGGVAASPEPLGDRTPGVLPTVGDTTPSAPGAATVAAPVPGPAPVLAGAALPVAGHAIGPPGAYSDGEPPALGGTAAAATLPPRAQSLAGQQVRLAAPEFGTAGAYSLLVVAGLVLLAATQLFRTMTGRRAEVR